MRGRGNSQKQFAVDCIAAEEMPESCCALLCWVIIHCCRLEEKGQIYGWQMIICLSEGRAWSPCCIGKCCLKILLWELGSTQLKEQFWHREIVVCTFTPRTPHWACTLVSSPLLTRMASVPSLPNATSAEQHEHRWSTHEYCSSLRLTSCQTRGCARQCWIHTEAPGWPLWDSS